VPTTFEGFPPDAFAFFAELEQPDNNRKAWFDENRSRYDASARQPLEALLIAASDEFGDDAKVFRPNRDVRFSRDKTPYKTSISALITIAGEGGPGHYLELHAHGILAGTGMHGFSRDQLQRYRAAVDDEASGEELRGLVDDARERGLQVGGDTLTRGPRGTDPDHPRIELLRHTALTAMRAVPPSDELSTAAGAELIFDVWRDGAALGRWLIDNVQHP
jgi:uncharacterized protein (TIGR02453 family)